MKIACTPWPIFCLLLLAWAESSAIATTVRQINPLSGAETIALDFAIHSGKMGVDNRGLPLFDQDYDRSEALEGTIEESLGSKISEAGYRFALTRDLYESEPLREEDKIRPHHALFIGVWGRSIPKVREDDEASFMFLVETTLAAEFYEPESETFDLDSASKLGFATNAQLENEITAVVSAMVDELLANNGALAFEQRVFLSEDGTHSVEITEPGYGDLYHYLRGDLRTTVAAAEVFSEPRTPNSKPLMSVQLPTGEIPEHVVIANNGAHLAILDSFLPQPGLIGRVYGANGTRIRDLALSDLYTETDLGNLPSPLYWRHATLEIDEAAELVTIGVPTCGIREKDCSSRLAKVSLALSSRAADSPKTNQVPFWKFETSLIDTGGEELEPLAPKDLAPKDLAPKDLAPKDQPAPSNFSCIAGSEPRDFQHAPFQPFPRFESSGLLALPAYTATARKARIAGTVGLELLVEKSGKVACVRAFKTLPMGLSEAAQETALQWRLGGESELPGNLRTQALVKFQMTLEPPN